MSKARLLAPLYFVIFFGYLGYSLFITVFTPLLLKEGSLFLPTSTPQDLRVLLLGCLLFMYPFGQFLSSPVLGALSDRFGRKPILLISVGISCLIYFILGISIWTQNFYLLIGSLLVAGLSEGNITIAQSSIADISTKQERGKLFGLIYVSTSFSYLIGPLIGGKLSEKKIFFLFSYQTPFFVVSVLLFFMYFWIFFSFRETHLPHKRIHLPIILAFTNMKNAFTLKKFRFLFFVNFILYLSIFGFLQNFPIYIVNKFDFGVWELSMYIAWTSIPFLIANIWMIGYLFKKYDPFKITVLSGISIALFLEFLLLFQNRFTILIPLFLVGFAIAICLPASSVLISIIANENEQGQALGINQSLNFLSEAIAGILIGLIGAILLKLSMMFFGVLAFIGSLCLFYYQKRRMVS